MAVKKWKDIAELIGLAAIVASLVFVGLQMRQEQQIARAESILSYSAIEVENLINTAEYSDLFVRANSGNELTESERFKLRMIMKAMGRQVFMASIAARPIGLDLRTTELRFASFLYRNPAAREAWLQMDADMARFVDPLRTPEALERTMASGSSAFRGRIKEHLKKLDDLYGQ